LLRHCYLPQVAKKGKQRAQPPPQTLWNLLCAHFCKFSNGKWFKTC